MMLLLAGVRRSGRRPIRRPRNRTAFQAGEIHAAAAAGDLVKLKSLLAADPALVRSRDGKGMTPLHIASRGKTPGGRGPSAGGRSGCEGGRCRQVHAAPPRRVRRRRRDAAGCFSRRGRTPRPSKTMSRTPLMLACGFGKDLETVKRLVAGGSDVNYCRPGRRQRPPLDPFLRQAGDHRFSRPKRSPAGRGRAVDRDGPPGRHQERPGGGLPPGPARRPRRKACALDRIVSLHDAANGGSVAIGKASVGQGVSRSTGKNVVRLDASARRRGSGPHGLCVNLLLERGAKIDDPDRMGRTAWHLARDNKHAETADLLKARGASHGGAEVPRAAGALAGPARARRHAGHLRARGSSRGSPSKASTARSPFRRTGTKLTGLRSSAARCCSPSGSTGCGRPPAASFMSPWGDGEPIFSPDGKRLYFLSFRPLTPGGRTDKENVWYVERAGEGWGEPKPESEAVNAFDHHWLFSVAADGTLYFSAVRDGGSEAGTSMSPSWSTASTRRRKTPARSSTRPAMSICPTSRPTEATCCSFRRAGRSPRGSSVSISAYRDGEGWTTPVGLGEKIDGIAAGPVPAGHAGREVHVLHRPGRHLLGAGRFHRGVRSQHSTFLRRIKCFVQKEMLNVET